MKYELICKISNKKIYKSINFVKFTDFYPSAVKRSFLLKGQKVEEV